VSKFISLEHTNDSIVNGFDVFEPLHHFLLQLLVADGCAYGDPPLDGFFNLPGDRDQFSWSLNVFRVHATGSSMESRDFEDAMGLFHMLSFHHIAQMDLGNGLRESDDGFQLSDSDGNTRGLLGDPLLLGSLPVIHIQVLEHVPCFLRESREYLHLGIGDVLAEIFDGEI